MATKKIVKKTKPSEQEKFAKEMYGAVKGCAGGGDVKELKMACGGKAYKKKK